MSLDTALFFAMNVATLTLFGFNASLLIAKSQQNSGYIALAVSFLSIAIVTCQPSLKLLAPSLQLPALIFSLPALLLIAPSFWLYIKALTAESKWQITHRDKKHFILPLIGLAIAFITLLLPSDIRHSLLVIGDEKILEKHSTLIRYGVYTGLVITFGLILGWCVQSAYYLFKIAQQLNRYRHHLKNIFSTTDKKELGWLTALAILIGIPWCVFAINVLLDNLFFPSTVLKELSSICLLMLAIFISFWGLRQKPGFEEIYIDVETQFAESNNGGTPQKYKTSALDKEQATLIATKIKQAMERDHVYLNANLSLPQLAKHVNSATNYISQTLNEQLNSNFFDYINRYRVMHAKKSLVESNSTVTEIAMNAGFNSKSAFYSAFKKYVGQTPIQYRNKPR